MSEMSLEARVEARLAKHKQLQASLKPSELVTQSLHAGAPGLPRAPLSTAPLQALSSTLNEAENQIQTNQRELTQTRSRMFTLERESQSYEEELKNKDEALRKTLADAAGERVALVEALTTARASADQLRIDSERKDDLIEKLEARISQEQLDFDDMQSKLREMSTSAQSEQHEMRFAREQLNVLETKNQILQKENEKLISERDELKDATLENRVVKSKIGQLDHEFEVLSQKYKAECDNNLNVRAELVQLKQEYAEVLSKFSNYTEEYDKYKRISAKYEEISREHDDLARKYRDIVDKCQELEFRQEKDSKLLALEREAAQKLGTVMKTICAMEAADDQLKVQGVEETVCYLQIQPVLLKLRQIVDINKQLREENATSDRQLADIKRDHQALSSEEQELEIRAETLHKSNERLTAAFETTNNELAQAKQQLQQKEGQYNKLVMECQLAMSLFNQKGDALEIGKMCQSNSQRIQQLTKEKEVLNQELDELACKYNGLEQANDNFNTRNQNLVSEIEALKRKMQEVREEADAAKQARSQLQQSTQCLGELVALLLRQINQLDRRLRLASEGCRVASISLANYIRQDVETQELCATQDEGDRARLRMQAIRRKLRKALLVQLFINRLKTQAQIAQQQGQLEVRALESVAPKNLEFAQIVAAIAVQYVHESGDLDGYGLAAMSAGDRAQLLQKLLSRSFEDCIVYRLGLPETMNLACGQFNGTTQLVCSLFEAKDSVINELALENSDVIGQHSQSQQENETLRKSVSELKERLVAEQERYLNLEGSLPQHYVPVQQHQELMSQNSNNIAEITNMEQRLSDLTQQNQSMQIEIESYQNEISRLNATIQSSDELVKTINAKFEEQMKAAVNMRELVQSYEAQIKQKDYEINSRTEEILKIKQQQAIAAQEEARQLQELEEMRRNIRERDAQTQELQAAIDKETRLRILAENAATAQIRQNEQAAQTQVYTRPPVPQQVKSVATRPKDLQIADVSGVSGLGEPKEFKSAVNKNEIQDLIKQLNMSLGDE